MVSGPDTKVYGMSQSVRWRTGGSVLVVIARLTHGFPGVRISRISVLPIPSSISGPLEPRVQDFPIDLGAGRRMGIWFRKAVGCSHLVHVLSRYLTPTPFIIPTQPRASSSNLYMEPPKPDIIPPPGLRGGLGVYSSGIGLLGLGRE